MSKKRIEFPMEVKQGSVVVKIYQVENKGRPSFTVSYHADGKRRLKMFADFEEAHAEAKSKAGSLSRGELDVLELRSRDRIAYVHAVEALKPTGVPLELAARDYAEAWKVLGGRVSLLEAAQEFARRRLHDLPSKLLPEAVKEMIAAKERDSASKAYVKVLKFYLGQLAETFHCQVRSVTSGQLSDFFRDMEVSARTRNNARATVGAFFTYCRERGWLPRDHEGITLVPKFKEKPTDIEVFTPLEMAHFLRYARPEMVPFLAIGGFAGLRSAEIERLDWAEVHLADRFIEVKAGKAKTASRRIVPMTENLAKWLAPHAQKEGRVVPFENMAKQIGWLVEDTNAGLKKEAEGSKAEAGKRKAENTAPKGGEGAAPVKFKPVKWKKNGLRHSFISYRVAEIQNVNQTALEAGNSSAVIFRHYRELVRPAEAKKWFGIEPDADGKVTVLPKSEEKKAAVG